MRTKVLTLTRLHGSVIRHSATNDDLVPLYKEWVMARLPTGERLGMPISLPLEEAFKALDESPQGTKNGDAVGPWHLRDAGGGN